MQQLLLRLLLRQRATAVRTSRSSSNLEKCDEFLKATHRAGSCWGVGWVGSCSGGGGSSRQLCFAPTAPEVVPPVCVRSRRM